MNQQQGVDLRKLKSVKHVVGGFDVSEGFISNERNAMATDATTGDSLHTAIPVLEFRFDMANGEARQPVSFTLGMVLPMIAELSAWATKHSGVGITEVQ